MQLLRILVTGGSGAVGSEVFERLRQLPDSTVATTATRNRNGCIPWRMGVDPAPAELLGGWDVVVHCAASTRWTMSRDEAEIANIRSTEALQEIVAPDSLLIHVSTAFCEPPVGAPHRPGPEIFRNNYEWSKYHSEQFALGLTNQSVVIRPPLVMGRRTDGWIARSSGIYTLLRAHVRGLLPAMVGDPDGFIELATTCDIADWVVGVVSGSIAVDPGSVHVLANGVNALRFSEGVSIMFGSVDRWRGDNGLDPIPHPPLVSLDRWDRFYLPFLETNVPSHRVGALTLLAEFSNYTVITTPIEGTIPVVDVGGAMATSVVAWCENNQRLARMQPAAW